MVQTYCLSVDFLENQGKWLKAYQSIGAQRQKRVDLLRDKKAQDLCIGGGVLLKHGLGVLGIDGTTAVMAYGKEGKPYLKDYGEVHFSLSHSGQWVVGSFYYQPIGIDIEQEQPGYADVAEIYFSREQRRILHSFDDELLKCQYFIREWTKMESYIKYHGKSFEWFQENKPREKQQLQFHSFPWKEPYQCTLCAPKEAKIGEMVELKMDYL